MKSIKNFFTSIKFNFLAFIIFILLWLVLSFFFEEYLIPSPVEIFKNISNYFNAGFFKNLQITFFRIIVGFLIALFSGTALGIFSYKWKIKPAINTLLILLEVIPGVILGVIFLLIFGIGNGVPVFMVAFLTLPLIAINTSNGLFKANINLEHFIISYGGNNIALIKYVFLPSLIPSFLTNLTLGFSLSLKVAVLGEFIGSQDGIGFLLNNARIWYNMKDVFFYLMVLIFIMFIFQMALDLIKNIYFKKFFYPD